MHDSTLKLCLSSIIWVKTMVLNLKRTLSVFSFALFTFAPFAASAETTTLSVSYYDGQTAHVEVKDDSRSLFPRYSYGVEFFNNPNISESDFTMRLSSFGSVSGCAHMTDASVKQEQLNDKIKLKVKDSKVKLNDDPRYANHDCDIKHLESYFDVKLNRDKLIKNGIKKIALENEKYGEYTTSEIDVNEDRIEFKVPTSDLGFHLITFYFFPKNSVILHAPHAKLGLDVKDVIREYGEARGLKPIEDRFEKFMMPHAANNYVFFIDPKSVYVRQLDEVGQNVSIGDAVVSRTVYTANGPVEENVSLELMATLPGQP